MAASSKRQRRHPLPAANSLSAAVAAQFDRSQREAAEVNPRDGRGV
jgi:hypothetical protein